LSVIFLQLRHVRFVIVGDALTFGESNLKFPGANHESVIELRRYSLRQKKAILKARPITGRGV
jgi:hypothetical protein